MIPVQSKVHPNKDEEILCFFNDAVMIESDKKEFSANDRYEASVSNHCDSEVLFNDIVFKSNFIKTFQAVMPKLQLSGTEKILEMGAAHGWASVLIKNKYPNCYVVASDLVPDTLKHAHRWEKLLQTNIDEKWSFNCRDIPFEDQQFDRIFTFASFHHFGEYGDYSKSLKEMVRILKPQGRIILLYEPSSPAYLYRLAFNRVNRRREIDGVDEDVLVVSKLDKITKTLNCRLQADFFPFHLYRDSVAATNYYYLLSKLSRLQKMLVSTVNLVIEKTPKGRMSG